MKQLNQLKNIEKIPIKGEPNLPKYLPKHKIIRELSRGVIKVVILDKPLKDKSDK